MFTVRSLLRLVATLVVSLAGPAAIADTLVATTSPAAQQATDTIHWNTLGPDQTVLPASLSVISAGGLTQSVALAGPNSVLSVVCASAPASCSWTGGNGFIVLDTLLWTSDAGNGGNGPVTLTFAKPIAGVGALVQADLPGAFTARLDLYNNATLLGSFTGASDANGDAVYIGAVDMTAASITSATISLTACATLCTDFAVGTVSLTTAPPTATPPTATTTLTSSANPAQSGSSVTFTASVASATGTPSGTVTFKDGSSPLGTATLSGGTATLTTFALTVGSHSITASYAGSSTAAVLIQTISAAATTTTLNSSPNPAQFGSSVTFTASVTGAQPTGTVSFSDGNVKVGTGTLSAGVASLSVASLAVGSHSITAVYAGDASNSPSASAAVLVTVSSQSGGGGTTSLIDVFALLLALTRAFRRLPGEQQRRGHCT
jgi:hypothetical protein